MSSVDSSLLSGASYLSHNIYGNIFCSGAASKCGGGGSVSNVNDKGNAIAFRVFVVLLGVVSTLLSLSTSTIYGLWVLAGDLGYVVVFPQFLAAVHMENHVNPAGSVAGAAVGVVLRGIVGEPKINFDAAVNLPTFADGSPMLPVKTIIMLASLATLLAVSKASKRSRNNVLL
jgi:high affinity choline transporter 7